MRSLVVKIRREVRSSTAGEHLRTFSNRFQGSVNRSFSQPDTNSNFGHMGAMRSDPMSVVSTTWASNASRIKSLLID